MADPRIRLMVINITIQFFQYISCDNSIKFIFLSLTVQKLFECPDWFGNLASRAESGGV